MNFCPSCGQQLAEDTRFCPNCGKTIQETQAPTEPAATEPQPTPAQAPQDTTAAPQAPFPQGPNTSPAVTEINPLLPHGPKQFPMLPGETKKEYAARQKPLLKAWKKFVSKPCWRSTRPLWRGVATRIRR